MVLKDEQFTRQTRGEGPERSACQAEEGSHTKNQKGEQTQHVHRSKALDNYIGKEKLKILNGSDFTNHEALVPMPLSDSGKKNWTKFHFSIETKPLEKECYLYGGWEAQKELVLSFSLANPALQILESQSNSL